MIHSFVSGDETESMARLRRVFASYPATCPSTASLRIPELDAEERRKGGRDLFAPVSIHPNGREHSRVRGAVAAPFDDAGASRGAVAAPFGGRESWSSRSTFDDAGASRAEAIEVE
jgi:hypothetical protein